MHNIQNEDIILFYLCLHRITFLSFFEKEMILKKLDDYTTLSLLSKEEISNMIHRQISEKVLWNEMMREISDLLNERQRYAVIAYYCEGASQAEIAKNLEISQQAASGLIQRALVIIRNYMQVNPSDVKRKRNKK